MLEAVGLECVRGDKRLFSGIGFLLGKGNLLHVEGPNGSGKSSLLRMLCGLVRPEAGQIRWAGAPIKDSDYAAKLAYIGHHNGLKEELSALENLRINCGLGGHDVTDSRALAALSRMGLKGREFLPCKVLSQGQKRRVALARLLLVDAPLWILDEPLAALDVSAVQLMGSLIKSHIEKEGMVILTTHQDIDVPRESIQTLTL